MLVDSKEKEKVKLFSVKDLYNSYSLDEALNWCSYKKQQLDLFDYVNINSIDLDFNHHINSFDVHESDLNGFNTDDKLMLHLLSQGGDDEWYVPSDIDTVFVDNLFDPNKLDEDESLIEIPRAQMDGDAKCSVTNDIKLLKRVTWYSKRVKGATSNERIVSGALGFL